MGTDRICLNVQYRTQDILATASIMTGQSKSLTKMNCLRYDKE